MPRSRARSPESYPAAGPIAGGSAASRTAGSPSSIPHSTRWYSSRSVFPSKTQPAARLQDQQRGGPGAVGVEEPTADRGPVVGEIAVRQRVVTHHVRALGKD